MTTPFPVLLHQAGWKINWAMEQQKMLHRILDHYSKNGVRLVPVEETEHNVRVRFVTDMIPIEASMLVGGAIHSLRSALDTAISRLYHEATGEFHDRINFPTHQTERELRATFDKGNGKAIAEKLPDLPSLIIDEIRPWKDGNYNVWALTRLDNVQKHKVIPLIVGGAGWRVNEISKGRNSIRNSVVMLNPGEETAFAISGVGELKIDADAITSFQCPVIDEYFPNRDFGGVLGELTNMTIEIVAALETYFKRSNAD